MKNLRLLLGAGLLALMTSCSISGPLLVTDNKALEKRGEASYNVWLGFIRPMEADASIRTAAKNGGITKVATVDVKVYGGLFKTTYTTIVTGE
ncbi:MAG: TRL domain-containing protein [Crocinitomicaceae bacterium]